MVQNEGHNALYNTYGIPCQDRLGNPFDLPHLTIYIRRFLAFAQAHSEVEFDLSPLCSWLASYTTGEIRAMFASAPANCQLLISEELEANG